MGFKSGSSAPPPAVVEQHTEQDEHQQSQRAQDGKQEQGVVGGDVPQAWMGQTQSCGTKQPLCIVNVLSPHVIKALLKPVLREVIKQVSTQ